MNQLRKCVIGPQVQIIPLEIIIHPFQSIVCLCEGYDFTDFIKNYDLFISNLTCSVWIHSYV